MITFFFKFALRKGEYQIKLGQIQTQYSLEKHGCSVQFCVSISKISPICMLDTQKCKKKTVLKMNSTPLPIFFISQQKIKMLPDICYTYVLFVCSFKPCIRFFITPTSWPALRNAQQGEVCISKRNNPEIFS